MVDRHEFHERAPRPWAARSRLMSDCWVVTMTIAVDRTIGAGAAAWAFGLATGRGLTTTIGGLISEAIPGTAATATGEVGRGVPFECERSTAAVPRATVRKRANAPSQEIIFIGR